MDDDGSDDDHIGDKQEYRSPHLSMQRMDAEIKSMFDEIRESFT
jgi:hypothetical protein